MGYYTHHTLEIKNVRHEDEANLVEAMEELDILDYALDSDYYRSKDNHLNFCCSDEVKWYSHNEDMIKLSKMFPHMIFKLHGEGEAHGDVWESYYHNGNSETCVAQIIMPEPEDIEWDD